MIMSCQSRSSVTNRADQPEIPHRQVLVALRALAGVQQRRPVDHINAEVAPAKLRERPQERDDRLRVGVARDE